MYLGYYRNYLTESSSSGNETVDDNTTLETTASEWALIIIVYILGLVGIVGNAAVCFVIYRTKEMHNATNYLIVNLAVADFSVSLFSPIHILFDRLDLWPSSVTGKMFYCHFIYTELLLWISTTASPLALMLVSFERFIGIVYPLHYNRLVTNSRLKMAVLSQWIIAIVPELSWIPLIYYNDDLEDCDVARVPLAAEIIVFTIQFVLSFGLPIVTLVYLYFRMFSSLAKYARIGIHPTNPRANETLRARKNILMNLFTVAALFIVLLTPCQIVMLWLISCIEFDGLCNDKSP